MSKHTPGPWKITEEEPFPQMCYMPGEGLPMQTDILIQTAYRPNGRTRTITRIKNLTCDIEANNHKCQHETNNELLVRAMTLPLNVDRANARLIAAAPDMYEVLYDFIEWVDERNIFEGSAHAQVADKARAAIAKAKEGI